MIRGNCYRGIPAWNRAAAVKISLPQRARLNDVSTSIVGRLMDLSVRSTRANARARAKETRHSLRRRRYTANAISAAGVEYRARERERERYSDERWTRVGCFYSTDAARGGDSITVPAADCSTVSATSTSSLACRRSSITAAAAAAVSIRRPLPSSADERRRRIIETRRWTKNDEWPAIGPADNNSASTRRPLCIHQTPPLSSCPGLDGVSLYLPRGNTAVW